MKKKLLIRSIKKKIIEKYLYDGKAIKTIYVKNRLINYIVK